MIFVDDLLIFVLKSLYYVYISSEQYAWRAYYTLYVFTVHLRIKGDKRETKKLRHPRSLPLQ